MADRSFHVGAQRSGVNSEGHPIDQSTNTRKDEELRTRPEEFFIQVVELLTKPCLPPTLSHTYRYGLTKRLLLNKIQSFVPSSGWSELQHFVTDITATRSCAAAGERRLLVYSIISSRRKETCSVAADLSVIGNWHGTSSRTRRKPASSCVGAERETFQTPNFSPFCSR